MYDNNHQNITGQLNRYHPDQHGHKTVRQINYKKREKILRIFFVSCFVVITIIAVFLSSIEIACTNLQTIPIIYAYITMTSGIYNLLNKIFTFLLLKCLMRKYHNFEYKKNFKYWIIYFCLDFASYIGSIYIYTVFRIIPINEGGEFDGFSVTIYLINAPQILIGLAIIFFKNNTDYIQDVSKLDYYEIVSIFQKPTIRERNDTCLTDDSISSSQ